jgi:hypothetical protein
MRIEGLRRYRNRNPEGRFGDLPPLLRCEAEHWLWKLSRKHRSLPGWLYAILCGQARRLALNPPTSEWGRSMRAKKGGYTVQRRYKFEGRNPTARARHMLKWIRKTRKLRHEQAEERARLGLPEPARHGFTNMDYPWD